MIAVVTSVSDFLPVFIQGAKKMHDALMPVAALICLAGLYFRVISTREDSVKIMAIARLVVVGVIIAQLPSIGNTIQLMVADAMKSSGFNVDSNVLADYQTAINTKFSTQGQNQNSWQFLFNGVDQIGITIAETFVYLLSLTAMILMWASTLIQALLYNFQLALSPLLLACIMVQALINLATRFCTIFISICMWAIGWAICDLLTKALIDMAVNSSNIPGLSVANGIHASLIWWLAIAIWVIFSSFLAPSIITAAIVTGGHHGVNLMMGGVIGGAITGSRMAQSTTRTVMTTGTALAGSGAGAAASRVASPTRGGVAPMRNFATRS